MRRVGFDRRAARGEGGAYGAFPLFFGDEPGPLKLAEHSFAPGKECPPRFPRMYAGTPPRSRDVGNVADLFSADRDRILGTVGRKLFGAYAEKPLACLLDAVAIVSAVNSVEVELEYFFSRERLV